MKARDRGKNRRVVLVIDHYVPQPDRDAGSRTMVQWMKLLLDQGLIVKFWPANLWYDPDYTSYLQQMGIEVFYGPEYANCFEKWLKENGKHLDYVLLSRPHISIEFIEPLRKITSAKLLYYGHDVHYLRIREERKVRPDQSKLAEEEKYWLDLEQRLWKVMDVIYYPSPSETEHVGSWLADNGVRAQVQTLPVFAYDTFQEDVENGPCKREGVLFVAGFGHPPNVDGALWFYNEVLPFIRARRNDIHFFFVGSNPTPEVQALAGEHLKVTGFVTDEELADYYKRARVVIAPLRFGAGVKGKVVEAMRFGVPVVTTSIGAQGLDAAADSIAVADDPVRFAEVVLQLLDDNTLWRKRSSAGVAAVRKQFSIQAMRSAVAEGFDLDMERVSADDHLSIVFGGN
jgi:glycosyltransferase involved in cell wall biosynthesis